MRRQRSLATLLTLAVLAAGLVGFAWGPKRAFSPQENRVLQQRPSFSLSRLLSGAYTQEVESIWPTSSRCGIPGCRLSPACGA